MVAVRFKLDTRGFNQEYVKDHTTTSETWPVNGDDNFKIGDAVDISNVGLSSFFGSGWTIYKREWLRDDKLQIWCLCLHLKK